MLRKRKQNFAYLIAGLGNPGKKYENTLHNTGYRVIDKLAQKLNQRKIRRKTSYLYYEAEQNGINLLLLKPITYMNLSGKAIKEAVNRYQLFPGNVMVIYDDMDLSPGVIRVRPRGGSGGHKGMKSIIEELGTGNFARIRIGIGKPPEGADAKAYVLETIEGELGFKVSEAEKKAAEAVMVAITEGIEEAMNKFNVLS